MEISLGLGDRTGMVRALQCCW